MALLLLPQPEQQFSDADGHPYAGGTIAVYIPGTDTPRDTWQDVGGTVLNTNPITLDAAGRALIWGVGDFRFVLKDADGNLVYDQVTSAPAPMSTTDVNSLIAVETSRATAAEATLASNHSAEVTRATAAEANLQTQVNAVAGLQFRYGTGITDSLGGGAQNFATPFPTTCDACVICSGNTGSNATARLMTTNAAGITCWIGDTTTGGGKPSTVFWYIAIGH